MSVRIYIALVYGATALFISILSSPAHADEFAEIPGGILIAEWDGQTITLPLEHTEISAKVHGRTAAITLRQTFLNDTDQSLDVTYLFPVGGDIQVLALAVDRAHGRSGSVALSDRTGQERLAHRISKLPASQRVTTTLQYSQSVDCAQGACELSLPMLQASLMDSRDIHDCSLVEAEDSFAQDLPSYLLEGIVSIPDDLAPDSIAVSVSIEADTAFEQIWSDTHPIDVTAFANRRQIDLAPADWISNRNFSLRYRLGEASVALAAANSGATPSDR